MKSLRQACRKLAANLQQTCSTLFSAPEKLRNSVQKCAASGTLPAHNRLRATESKVVRQNWNCVREVCHNIFLFLTSFICVPEVRQRIFFVFLFCQGIKSVRQSVPEKHDYFLVYLCVLKLCVNWDCVQLKGEST